MRTIQCLGRAAALVMFVVGFAPPVQAGLIGYNFFLEDSSGSPRHTGSLFLDEALVSGISAPTFISFDQIANAFIPGSLSITLFGVSSDLSHAQIPDREGVITDASGTIVSFHDTTTGGVLIGFSVFVPPVDDWAVSIGGGLWFVSTAVLPPVTPADVEGPTHSFRRIPRVPVPPTMFLFAVGATALVNCRRPPGSRRVLDRRLG